MSNWLWATNWGSLRAGDPSDNSSAFHAGHLNDALRLFVPPFNPVLVASDTSGVWLANETGGMAFPLGWTWPDTHFNCLCHGVYSSLHTYAAGSALYETDTTSPSPLLNWRKIDILKDLNQHEWSIGEIYRAIVVQQYRRLILATDAGVFWADIPAAGGSYLFKQAKTLPGVRYSGLAESSSNRVIVGAWGTDQAKHFGIFVGEWSNPAGDLIFKPATIKGKIDVRKMLRTEIGACEGDRTKLFAVCGGGGQMTPKFDDAGNVLKDGYGDIKWDEDKADFILRVLRSSDSGLTWDICGNAINGSADVLFGGTKDVIGQTQWGYNLCVGVSPFNPKLVAVGVGSFAISEDGGDSWSLAPSSPHLHTDTHGLIFDRFDPARVKLLICSDGGLATSPDLMKTFDTACNRLLPNFQCTRFSPSPLEPGLLGMSLQDNGDVYTTLYINPEPWRDLDGGDGILMMFLSTGNLIRNNNTLTAADSSGNSVEFGLKTRASEWAASTRTFSDLKLFPDPPLSWGVIPVDGTADGLLNPEGDRIEAVVIPTFANPAGELMLAVAAEGEKVLGLFKKQSGELHWTQLAAIPHKPSKDAAGNELPYSATAVASLDGKAVFVGTNNGLVFRLDSATGASTDISNPVNSKAIGRLAAAATALFAIAASAVFRFDGANWTTLGGGLPANQDYSALELDRMEAPLHVFVGTDQGVWESWDEGKSWGQNGLDLPSAVRCQDLRIVTERSGARFLYLSTFGWSVFRKLLNMDPVEKTIAIDGHMDLVDRVVTGHDIWAHPVFSNIFKLGPLHPIEGTTIVEDDGDEIRVVLKVGLEWFNDFSVDVTYDVTLLAKDEDNAVDDHSSGKFKVPLGDTKIQVVDLASDEWWPDRAHVEIKVTN
jgi:hypothetical protein